MQAKACGQQMAASRSASIHENCRDMTMVVTAMRHLQENTTAASPDSGSSTDSSAYLAPFTISAVSLSGAAFALAVVSCALAYFAARKYCIVYRHHLESYAQAMPGEILTPGSLLPSGLIRECMYRYLEVGDGDVLQQCPRTRRFMASFSVPNAVGSLLYFVFVVVLWQVGLRQGLYGPIIAAVLQRFLGVCSATFMALQIFFLLQILASTVITSALLILSSMYFFIPTAIRRRGIPYLWFPSSLEELFCQLDMGLDVMDKPDNSFYYAQKIIRDFTNWPLLLSSDASASMWQAAGLFAASLFTLAVTATPGTDNGVVDNVLTGAFALIIAAFASQALALLSLSRSVFAVWRLSHFLHRRLADSHGRLPSYWHLLWRGFQIGRQHFQVFCHRVRVEALLGQNRLHQQSYVYHGAMQDVQLATDLLNNNRGVAHIRELRDQETWETMGPNGQTVHHTFRPKYSPDDLTEELISKVALRDLAGVLATLINAHGLFKVREFFGEQEAEVPLNQKWQVLLGNSPFQPDYKQARMLVVAA